MCPIIAAGIYIPERVDQLENPHSLSGLACLQIHATCCIEIARCRFLISFVVHVFFVLVTFQTGKSFIAK